MKQHNQSKPRRRTRVKEKVKKLRERKLRLRDLLWFKRSRMTLLRRRKKLLLNKPDNSARARQRQELMQRNKLQESRKSSKERSRNRLD